MNRMKTDIKSAPAGPVASRRAPPGDRSGPISQRGEGDAGYPPEALVALTELLDDFARAGLRYCLWKSNVRLPQALAGKTDLDLLVDPSHAGSFRDTIERHPVKRIVPPPDARYPGMEHYLGFDRMSGRLFHLHVHYELVLGERYVKNHRLPLERELLDSRRMLSGAPVPSAALELCVLAVRALLKYRGRDVIKDVFKIRSPGLPDELYEEILWLLDQTSRDELHRALARTVAVIPSRAVSEFLDAIVRGRRPGFALWRFRRLVRTQLGTFQRHSRVNARVGYLAAAWSNRTRVRRTPSAMRQMSPAGGGRSIGLVGADGAGKSTIAWTLSSWLSWKVESRVCYMGSKQPSRASTALYLMFRAQRRGHRSIERRLGPGSRLTKGLAVSRDVTLGLHHLSIGRDRMRRYRAALRERERGAIVIFDRFPMECLSREPAARLLDGPQIARSVNARSGVLGLLAAWEERLYARFRLPDHLFVLVVSPSVSLGRKPDHSADLLLAKSVAVADLARLALSCGGSTHVGRIDADRALDEVMLEAKARLWDAL
ncbi:MAG: hypothetical protein M3516_01795 [Actinomycetota bacterium]|nr:hypothetical protein [Actinomycetota bacterium]